MDSARSIEFKFHMDLQKKLREVIADIIPGNYSFSYRFVYHRQFFKKNFLTDAARSSVTHRFVLSYITMILFVFFVRYRF